METGEERELSPKMNILGYNLRWSPDGRSILVRGYDTQNRVGVYPINPRTGEVLATVLGAYWAEWSRDGKAIVYAMNDPIKNARPLVVRDLETGQEKELYRGWDGRWLAFSSFDLEGKESALNVMPATGGSPRELLRLKHPEDFGVIAWTPDGRQLLFVRRDFNASKFELWLISAEGGAPQRMGLAMQSVSQISVHPDGRRLAFNAGESKTEVWVMENFLLAHRAAR